MGHGGKRPGAGRKPGATTRRTRATADRDAALGLLDPLDLVLERMRAEYAAGNYAEAVRLAEIALPYKHPKLANLATNNRTAGTTEVVVRYENDFYSNASRLESLALPTPPDGANGDGHR
jgi:hypothetical protein